MAIRTKLLTASRATTIRTANSNFLRRCRGRPNELRSSVAPVVDIARGGKFACLIHKPRSGYKDNRNIQARGTRATVSITTNLIPRSNTRTPSKPNGAGNRATCRRRMRRSEGGKPTALAGRPTSHDQPQTAPDTQRPAKIFPDLPPAATSAQRLAGGILIPLARSHPSLSLFSGEGFFRLPSLHARPALAATGDCRR